MNKITLLLFLLSIPILSAQNVYEIPWEEGVEMPVASPTIEVGDTVIWVWTDNSQKSVTSISGAEAFDSGLLSGVNQEFSITFTHEGITRYHNDLDALMRGKIRVVGKLSSEEKFVKNLNFYPNPVTDKLTISSLFVVDSYQVYNVLGTLVSEGKGGGISTYVDMSRLSSGLYFVKVVSNTLQATLKIAKE
ncbi:T9SS type A sorting domain-containing protein [Aequorivita marina]|uniref:T9SS type A sorting domain-containing protein n=1 Tax=Aequorivita marina TaxID=3073654 RepID=UPI0028769424|nr:T9SS type A sorting domain-containing protein [Aequorivita sp. S2608]MDS1299584.1 T9SS type A sorting domain-containing protein [Aequorivita sp. S2608]